MNILPASIFGFMHKALEFFFNPNSIWYWGWMPVYFVVGGLTLFARQIFSNEKFSLKKIISNLLPKFLYRSASTRLDFKFLILKLLIGTFVSEVAFYFIAGRMAVSLAKSWNFVELKQFSVKEQVIATVLILVAMDFGYVLFHFLAHKVPFLWKLHRVHHSATELTPLTNERVHPLERLLEYSFVSCFIFVGSFAIIFFMGGLPAGANVHGVSLSILIFAVLPHLNHLRHSQIWLSFGPLNWLLSSPCMHQIHHSSDIKHHDKNFARLFSVFDLLLGTLYIPDQYEHLNYGVMEEGLMKNFSHTLSESLIKPLRNNK
jgi:sterol desaturase/sphingolipid hydroxylase (fatty acid hydroxylase superfamily)